MPNVDVTKSIWNKTESTGVLLLKKFINLNLYVILSTQPPRFHFHSRIKIAKFIFISKHPDRKQELTLVYFSLGIFTRTWVGSLGWEDPLEKGKAAHASILAWRIPWTV